jgi:serine/threonine-protein kinase SRPK3
MAKCSIHEMLEQTVRHIPGDEIDVFADLLDKILKYNPRDRLTANAAQRHEWFKM